MKIETLLPGIQKNISLSKYTTFRIGGPAKYFLEVNNKEELIKAIETAKLLKIPFFILGKGSNILVSDKGYNGLVIKIKSQSANWRIKIKNTAQKSKIIEAESGVLLSEVIALAFKNNLTGLEWAAGIPGTIGGAIRGNAGAFGSCIAEVVNVVEVLEIQSIKSQDSKFKIKIFKNKNCQFQYRNSIFKNNPKLIILSAEFQLKKGYKKEIQKKIKEYLDYRRKNHPLNFPSAGSIFKNYHIKDKKEKEKLFRNFPELQKIVVQEMVPAGFLIAQCGLPGKRIGAVQISEKHANFILNLGEAEAKDVKKLINLIKIKIKNKFKIKLEEEIQYLGF